MEHSGLFTKSNAMINSTDCLWQTKLVLSCCGSGPGEVGENYKEKVMHKLLMVTLQGFVEPS
jgi:hypothetical protein